MFNRLKQSRAAIVIMAILLSLIIGGVVIWASGNNPIEIYGKMLNGALGSQFAIASTIRWTTPVLFTGVAAAITFQGGMFNPVFDSLRKKKWLYPRFNEGCSHFSFCNDMCYIFFVPGFTCLVSLMIVRIDDFVINS